MLGCLVFEPRAQQRWAVRHTAGSHYRLGALSFLSVGAPVTWAPFSRPLLPPAPEACSGEHKGSEGMEWVLARHLHLLCSALGLARGRCSVLVNKHLFRTVSAGQ